MWCQTGPRGGFQVLEPAELIEQVLEELGQMSQLYKVSASNTPTEFESHKRPWPLPAEKADGCA